MNDVVDLSPYNLLIATPQADGRPEDSYNTSLDNTKQLIRQYGGAVENFKTKYISDIAFARSKLFGAFLRNKKYTHLLMVDADQDWEPTDVVWMLLLKRDFLAAVSCKKMYPIQFAFNMTWEDGTVKPFLHELGSNVAEIPFVGGAFVMISRNCVEKMAEAYKDLAYDMDDGIVEYAVFDPIILQGNTRRRLSEDYAFCHRWRKIGGKTEVKMDIDLGHTGSHRFSGSLYEYFLKTQPGFVNNA